jgi:hypothetical protein
MHAWKHEKCVDRLIDKLYLPTLTLSTEADLAYVNYI